MNFGQKIRRFLNMKQVIPNYGQASLYGIFNIFISELMFF